MLKKDEPITVLSLFDGCSAAFLALERAGYTIKKYYSSEIDKNALAVQSYHYSADTRFHQVGDVRTAWEPEFFDVDLIIMGSPCTQLSSVNKNDRSGLEGKDSKLFFDALKIIQLIAVFHTRPKVFFIAENVASMSKINRDAMTSALTDVFPDTRLLKIDSAIVAPAHRRRLYWTNLPNASVPKETGVKFQDILVNGYTDKVKANVLLSSNVTATNGIFRHYKMDMGNIIFKEAEFAQLPTQEKFLAYPDILKGSGYDGRARGNNDEYAFPNGCYRVPSVLERERMMTFPDGYISEVPNVSRTEKNKILGLSFTVGVVAHLLR
jgi:DNA (cytosine-5)-methyltransferase 3A